VHKNLLRRACWWPIRLQYAVKDPSAANRGNLPPRPWSLRLPADRASSLWPHRGCRRRPERDRRLRGGV